MEALIKAGAAPGVDVADGDGETPLLEGLARDETGDAQARQSSELRGSNRAKPVVLPVGASGASGSRGLARPQLN